MYGLGGQIEMTKECKRDLEADAKRLKKRIDEFKEFDCAIKNFINAGHIHWIDGREDRKTMFVLCGAFSLEIPSLEAEYNKILAKIEEER